MSENFSFYSHQLDYFEKINFNHLLPEDFDNTQPSVFWSKPAALSSKEEEELGEIDIRKLADVLDDIERGVTIPPEVLKEDNKQVQEGDAREAEKDKRPEPADTVLNTEPPPTYYDDEAYDEYYQDKIPDNEKSVEKDDRKLEKETTTEVKETHKETKEKKEEPPVPQQHPSLMETIHQENIPDEAIVPPLPVMDGIVPPLPDIPENLRNDMPTEMSHSEEKLPAEVPETDDTPEIPSLSFSVTKAWDGRPIRHPAFNISMSGSDQGLLLYIEAPYYEDPPMPIEDPKKPFYKIDAHEGKRSAYLFI